MNGNTSSSPVEVYNMMSGGGAGKERNCSEGNSSSSHDASSAEAIESLLLLGREPILGPSSTSSSSSQVVIDKGGSNRESSSPEGISYYQRMRIRNNEASKRCRLKRRLKAEQLENQNNLLSMSNKLLKQRILRLNKICALIKDCVKDFKGGEGYSRNCTCFETIAAIKKLNRETPDSTTLSNEELLANSKLNREIENTFLHQDFMGFDGDSDSRRSSSDDEKRPKLIRSLSATVPSKTSLDVINETIVKTLKSPLSSPSSTASQTTSKPSFSIANSTSVNITVSGPNNQQRQSVNMIKTSPGGGSLQVLPSQLMLVTTPKPSSRPEEVFIKCEPGVRIVEEVVETSSNHCVISASDTFYKDTPCGGELHGVNKLTGYLDLNTRTLTRDNGSSAAERVIIQSALGLPFWQADEIPTFICDNHRQDISFQSEFTSCVICGKKKKKPFPTPMYTITYRMSLEHHMTSGKILPIGQLICCTCKDRHLKSGDPGRDIVEQERPAPQSVIVPNLMTVAPQLVEQSNNSSSSDCKQNDLKVIVQPVPRMNNFQSGSGNNQIMAISSSTAHFVDPPSALISASSTNDNIFQKISRLNEALQAVNPRYKPIGFSITSIESCSPSVLQDAVAATDTAISTLLSVIAPGQEALLWESVKFKLDEKYRNLTTTTSPI